MKQTFLLLMTTLLFQSCGQGLDPNATTSVIENPVTIPTPTYFAPELSLGQLHSCALVNPGIVKCWGYNTNGQIGQGSTSSYVLTPKQVPGLTDIKQISSGLFHTCALTKSGNVKCWGRNDNGNIGDGTVIQKTSPTDTGLTNVTSLSTGLGSHTCAVLNSGTVKCWGDNNSGQIGNGTGGFSVNSPSPVNVNGLSNVKQVVTGVNTTCALLLDETVKCWGGNSNGEMGDGTFWGKYAPTAVISLVAVKELIPGMTQTCARFQNNTFKCWGDNFQGILGDNTTNDRSTPVDFNLVPGVKHLAYGILYVCATLDTEDVKCWGMNTYKVLGDVAAPANTATPTSVVNVTNVVKVFAGSYHACALLDDNRVQCWGRHDSGQLGDGNKTNVNTGTPDAVFVTDLE